MCFNAFEKKQVKNKFFKNKKVLTNTREVNQLKQSEKKNMNHNPRYLYLREFSTQYPYSIYFCTMKRAQMCVLIGTDLEMTSGCNENDLALALTCTQNSP